MKKKLLFGDYRGVLVNLAYKDFYSFGVFPLCPKSTNYISVIIFNILNSTPTH